MLIETITPSRAVDNAFLQETITSKDFEQFRTRLLKLINSADTAVENEESEEHLKNLIKPFLDHTNFGEEYYINTKERQDLAIHNGKTGSSTVGVILEAKRPLNKEMITGDDINRKAFQEAILYFLRERIENKNDDIKHIIITDVYKWFVFDAQDFERYFHDSKKLRGWYSEWKKGQKVSSKTQFVYDHLSEFIQDLDESIKSTVFDIRDYKTLLEKEELGREEQKKLVPLFKLFTPTHLLKLPFASDSNNLNKGFYRELLYIMGLQEYKEKGTHYITRLNEDDRNPASLIENTITQLESLNVLSQISNRAEYGETDEEQLFNVAIQLLITWVNRILFLKLLEAQLYKYHQEDDRFRFLSHRQIEEYDGLNKLFFQVLAVPEKERSERISESYSHIPYLNSSLFDVADIERVALRISELEDGLQLPVHSRSKIRNREGDRLKGESISALEYLLRFLDAYSFNTEGTAEVQEEAKTLINASVLGRIFEKINGYKDGSFFTPGYITEYMCQETIRRAVVQKFNEAFEDWNCDTIGDVRSKLSRHEVSYKKANDIVNSTTICDPAVGSGHFLVSALNEMIAIKHDLRIFVDEHNERIRDVEISVDHDELRISIGSDPFFEYRVEHEWKEPGDIKRTVGSDTQRLQRALFREKNILIENCLFGVDINPNSVNICRLRLWVELLKHAYYREDTDYQSLEVLPNIDINIKQGNSLVSRFDLDADLSAVFKDSDYSVDDYKDAVRNYKHSRDRAEKRRLQTYIDDVKEEFSTTLINNRPINKKLSKARGKLELMNNKDLWGGTSFTKKEIKQQGKEVKQLEEQKAEEESGVFYNQAYEWRFEFPEVLDEDGEFIGFDAVIGNPPYIRQELLKDLKPYLKENYSVYYGSADLYQYFVERGIELLRPRGYLHYIISKKWMRTNYGKPLREWIQNYQIESIIDFGDLPVFEGATVYPCLLQIEKNDSQKSFEAAGLEHLDYKNLQDYLSEEIFSVDQTKLQIEGWALVDERSQELLEKLKRTGKTLRKYVENKIYYGIKTGYNDAFIIDDEIKDQLITEDTGSADLIKPFLRGREIKRYEQPKAEEYLIFTRRGVEIEDYPAVLNYLEGFKESLEPRPKNVNSDDWEGRKPGSYKWYEIQDTIDYHEEFEKPKIIIPAIVKSANYAFDTENMYSNDKTTIISKDDKYLLGILNSKLSDFFIFNISNTKRGGYYEYKPMYVENIPIAEPLDKERKEIEKLVDRILTAKEDKPDADTTELEVEIDQLVYELYGLSEEEIAIVEGSVN